MKHIKKVLNLILCIYVLLSLISIGAYLYERYVTKFDDIVLFTPTVFKQDVFEGGDNISFYSFMGTPVENSFIQIQDPLFCKDLEGLWERINSPDIKEFTLKIDTLRNETIQKINDSIGEYDPANSNAIKTLRDFGETIVKNGDGFLIDYDIGTLDRSFPRECRLKIYYTTETKFFKHRKTVQQFTNIITIK